jgi:putative two-component system response regulator
MSETITKQLVCIVDDDKTNVEILGITLGDDYEICSAYSGEQALEMIEKRMPDVVLLDIIMPDILGYDVCKRLKENPVTKNIPVIFLTGLEDQQDEEHGFEVGAVDYVTKPVSATIVRAKTKCISSF